MKLPFTARFKANSTREVFGAVSWNFLGMFFSLVTGILTARILDPENRGLLALALTISSLSYLCSSVGTNSAVRTLQPRYSWASFRTYFLVSVFLLAVNAVFVLAILFFFVELGFVEFSDHVIAVALLGTLTFVSNQLLDMFNAAGRASQSARANTVGHFATMISLLIVFLWGTFANLQGVLVSYSLSFAVRILVMFVLARNADFEFGGSSRAGRKKFLGASTKFWGINLSQTLTLRSDQFLLGVLSNAYHVGVYAVAVTPATLMQVAANSIGQVAYREAATGSMTLRRLIKFLTATFVLSFCYGVLLWLLAPILIPLVYGQDYDESVPIVRVLVISGLLLSPYSVLLRVLAGLNYPYVSTFAGVVGVITLAISSLILVPSHGALGAATSTIFAYSVMLIVAGLGIFYHYRNKSS